jgi:hypothetical protein
VCGTGDDEDGERTLHRGGHLDVEGGVENPDEDDDDGTGQCGEGDLR